VEVYTIGFAQHSAEGFFEALKQAGIRRLLDVRLNNVSQLAGFTKRGDLAYFLRELAGADYVHDAQLAPSADLLSAYRRATIDWEQYELRFMELMNQRHVERAYGERAFAVPTALLCSEFSAEKCHRRLVLDYLAQTSNPELIQVHL
jgi:uncharacterized protein (DUF488 family)